MRALLLVVLIVVLSAGAYLLLDSPATSSASAASAGAGAGPASPVGPGGPSELAAVEPASVAPMEGPTDGRRAALPGVAEADPSVVAAAAVDGATFSGRVLDERGRPLAGAEVVLARPGQRGGLFGGRGPARADGVAVTTDPAGRFSAAPAREGEVAVRVGLDGYEPLVRDAVAVAGVATDLGDLTLAPGIVVSGRVVDERGAPVAGATISRERPAPQGLVILGDFADSRLDELTETGADGAFEVRRLAAGDWKLVIDHERHPRVTHEGDTARPGERRDGVVIVLPDGVAISGLVTGLPADADELVVRARRVGSVGLSIEGFDTLRFAGATPVATGGAFVIEGLEKGALYELAAYTKGEGAARRSDRLRATAGDVGVRLTHGVGATVALRVTDAASGAPIADAVVSSGFGYLSRRAEVDDRGEVLLDDLWPSEEGRDLIVEVTAPGHAGWRRDDVRVRPGDALDLGVIPLAGRPEVVVRVTDPTGAPVEGADVTLAPARRPAPRGGGGVRARRFEVSFDTELAVPGDGAPEMILGGDRESARTGPDGVARLGSLPGRTAQVSVTAAGFARWRSEVVDLPSSAGASFDAVLSEGGAVVVLVLDAEGDPLPGASVEHRDPAARGGPMQEFRGGEGERTDARGRARFDHLAVGPQRFRLEPRRTGGGGLMIVMAGGDEDEGDGWSEVVVTERGEHELTLVAPPAASLAGVVLEDGAPLSGANVKVRGENPGGFGLGGFSLGGGGELTDGAGRFRLEDLEPGRLVLDVSHPSRVMSESIELDLVEGENSTRIELPVSIVEGRVTDPQGAPVADAKVTVKRAAGDGQQNVQLVFVSTIDDGGESAGAISYGSGDPEVRTDVDGRFQLRGVAAEIDIVVEARKDGFRTATSEAFDVAPGGLRRGVDLMLDAGGTIVATYAAAGTWAVIATPLDEAGEPSGSPETGILRGGRATLEDLPPGSWRVALEPTDPEGAAAPPAPVEVTVTANLAVTAAFE